MDIGHGIEVYRHMTAERVLSNSGPVHWPRFTRQQCGGGNRNGHVFREYNEGAEVRMALMNQGKQT